jgi:hypothetical protein
MVAKQGLLAVVLSMASAQAFAGEAITTGSFPVAKRNVVTVSVPILEQGTQVSLEGEHVLGDRFSVGLGVFTSFRHQRQRFTEPAEAVGRDSTAFQVGLAPSARFYLTGSAPQGLWLSPRVELGLGGSSSSPVGAPPDEPVLRSSSSDNWSVGAMAVLGYSVVLEPGFTVQGGVGVGARRDTFTSDLGMIVEDRLVTMRVRQSVWNFTERLVVNVGWAF